MHTADVAALPQLTSAYRGKPQPRIDQGVMRLEF